MVFMNVSTKIQKVASALFPRDMFLSLFAMNQRYGCLRCMKSLAIIRIKKLVSVVQTIDIFFSLSKKIICKCSVRTVTWLSCFEACPESGRDWMNDLCDRKIEEDKTDSMLWLDFNKILKRLIGNENI